MSAERTAWEEAVAGAQRDASRAALVRDGYYDADVSAAARRFAESSEWRAVQAWLPRVPGAAVDVGAGRGIASYALARDGWRVTAVEPDDGEVVGRRAIAALCDSTHVPVAIIDGTAERLPIGDASQDLVYARAVLHHVRDLGRACAEMFRVLRPGGRLIATREHVVSDEAQRKDFLVGHPLQAGYGGENAYRCEEYRNAMTGAGFKLVADLGPFDAAINYFPYTDEDAWGICMRPLILRFGWRLTRLMASPAHAFGRRLYAQMARRTSMSDDRPGRLHSFIADRERPAV